MTKESKELRGGRYALVRTLGEGSQGETWEAIDRGTKPVKPSTDGERTSLVEAWSSYVQNAGTPRPKPARGERVVAIKCFRVGKAKAWKDVELAEREARTLASLDHPNLPRYVEHFEEDGALYLVMEKIDGESLASIRKAKRTLAPDEIQRMLEDAAKALRYLHGRAPAIVHRDIKPGNIIRRPNGPFVLVDFGAVRDRMKPEGGSTVVGTFGYMAPEQFQGRASPKSDVYGVGATALAMLTGCEPEDLPHEGLALDVDKAVPHGTSRALVRALEVMLEPDPDRRIGSVDDALALLSKGEEKQHAKDARADNRKKRRAEKRQKRDDKRPDQKRRNEEWRAHGGARVPLFARVFGRLGLLIALIAVTVTVGALVPLLLTMLSLLFGDRLRDGARACQDASRRVQAALGQASARLSGRTVPARFRVTGDFDRVRSVTEGEAQAMAMREAQRRGEDADAWLEEKLEGEAEKYAEEQQRRAQMRRHSEAPPKRKR